MGSCSSRSVTRRLTAPFSVSPPSSPSPPKRAKDRAITSESETTNELSEKGVINVVLQLGAKYSEYWAGLAPMSGPQESGYLWEKIRRMPNFVTEGTHASL